MKLVLTQCDKQFIAKISKTVAKCKADAVEQEFSIWQEFPNFVGIDIGSEVEGDLVKNDKGYWTLYAPKTSKTAFKRTEIAQAVKDKAKAIESAQERKNDSIQLASSIRMATDIVVALIAEKKITDPEVVKQDILRWRKWYLDNWNTADGVDTQSGIPF